MVRETAGSRNSWYTRFCASGCNAGANPLASFPAKTGLREFRGRKLGPIRMRGVYGVTLARCPRRGVQPRQVALYAYARIRIIELNSVFCLKDKLPRNIEE